MVNTFIVFLLVCATYSKRIESKNDLVYTPHGMRPRECVIFHNESEVELNPIFNGTWVHYPKSGRRKFLPIIQKCIENSKTILFDFFNDEPRDMEMGIFVKVTNMDPPIRNYSGYIGVPDENLPTLENGMFSYWTGLSSTQQQPNNESSALLQPVLGWCSTTTCMSDPPNHNTWNYASWQCCPHGNTHRSGPNFKAEIGENIFTYAYSDPSSGNTEVYMKGKEGISSLKSSVNHMIHDNLMINMEIHDMDGDNCDHFNDKPCTFTQLKIIDTNGKNIDMSSLKWNYVDKNPNGCNGEGKWNSPTSFQIVGSK
eukprot:389980_1